MALTSPERANAERFVAVVAAGDAPRAYAMLEELPPARVALALAVLLAEQAPRDAEEVSPDGSEDQAGTRTPSEVAEVTQDRPEAEEVAR